MRILNKVALASSVLMVSMSSYAADVATGSLIINGVVNEDSSVVGNTGATIDLEANGYSEAGTIDVSSNLDFFTLTISPVDPTTGMTGASANVPYCVQLVDYDASGSYTVGGNGNTTQCYGAGETGVDFVITYTLNCAAGSCSAPEALNIKFNISTEATAAGNTGLVAGTYSDTLDLTISD